MFENRTFEELKQLFFESHSYICVGDSILKEAFEYCSKGANNIESFVDRVADYILSQDLQEDIEL